MGALSSELNEAAEAPSSVSRQSSQWAERLHQDLSPSRPLPSGHYTQLHLLHG